MLKKIFILLLSLGIGFSIRGQKTEEIKYELVMDAFFFENKIFKPNAALLLTDKKEIKEDAKMFLAKQKKIVSLQKL